MPAERARSHRKVTLVARLALLLGAILPVTLASSANASALLTIEPITWNVIGLDSNDVSAGPNVFPVGARVCNDGDATASNVTVDFVWDSANSLINLSGASNQTVTTLAPQSCQDFYFDVVITRSTAAYDTTRSYHVTASADGIGEVSTPTPREVYVERLVSQNRNAIQSISGPTTVFVGQTYTYTLVARTATNGYQQLESFVTFPNVIFRIDSVSSTYSAPPGATNDKLYADACGWDNNPLSATYRACIGPEDYADGKAGGDITTTFTVTILSAGSADLTALIYDFSGSSYHYNSDFGTSVLSVTAVDAMDSADLSITKTDSPDPVTTGEDFTYTLSTANAGPSDASAVTVTDDLPAGTTFVSASGVGWTCTQDSGIVSCTRPTIDSGSTAPDITITLTAPAAGGDIANEASVTSSVSDPTPGNNTATEVTTVTPSADVSLTKTHTGDFAAGENGIYTLTVSNGGPSAAEADITVTDTLPAGLTFVSGGGSGGFTCSAVGQTVTCVRTTSLAPDASASFDITVAAADAAVPEVTNTASASSETGDPNIANNSASDQTTVEPTADVTLSKTDSADPVTTGTDFTYTLSVTNDGPSDATEVSVIDELPSGTTFVSVSGTGWSCDHVSGTVTCTRDALADGASAPDIAIAITAPSSAGTITNSASVSAAENDETLGDNFAIEQTTTQRPAKPPPPPDEPPEVIDDPTMGSSERGWVSGASAGLPLTGRAAGTFLATGFLLIAAGSLTVYYSRRKEQQPDA